MADDAHGAEQRPHHDHAHDLRGRLTLAVGRLQLVRRRLGRSDPLDHRLDAALEAVYPCLSSVRSWTFWTCSHPVRAGLVRRVMRHRTVTAAALDADRAGAAPGPVTGDTSLWYG
jgi:hypothetical protein